MAASSDIGESGEVQALSTADHSAVAYLGALQRLIAEISWAAAAIAGNRPAQFLESTDRQEALLSEIARLRTIVGHSQDERAPAITRSTAAEIQLAERSLCNSVRSYSALLQRSAQSVLLLTRLHRSYAAGYPGAGQPGRVRMTWSCEG